MTSYSAKTKSNTIMSGTTTGIGGRTYTPPKIHSGYDAEAWTGNKDIPYGDSANLSAEETASDPDFDGYWIPVTVVSAMRDKRGKWLLVVKMDNGSSWRMLTRGAGEHPLSEIKGVAKFKRLETAHVPEARMRGWAVDFAITAAMRREREQRGRKRKRP